MGLQQETCPTLGVRNEVNVGPWFVSCRYLLWHGCCRESGGVLGNNVWLLYRGLMCRGSCVGDCGIGGYCGGRVDGGK